MGRYYDTPKGQFPSVTTVLQLVNKPLLIPWAVKCCVEYILSQVKGKSISRTRLEKVCRAAKHHYKTVAKEAADIGTETHKAVETWLKDGGREIPLSSLEAASSFLAFKNWWHEQDGRVLHVEEEIYSEYGYAGCLDLIVYLDGVKTLVDLKTSKNIYEDMGYQLAAYREAWNEINPDKEPVKAEGIIRVDKPTGQWEYRDFTEEHDRNFQVFLNYLSIFQLTVQQGE